MDLNLIKREGKVFRRRNRWHKEDQNQDPVRINGVGGADKNGVV